MKWKYLLIVGVLIGAFSLGAMLGPVSEPTGETNVPEIAKEDPIVQAANVTNSNVAVEEDNLQVANENEAVQQPSEQYVCPITGVVVGSGNGMGRYFAGSMPTVIADALGMTVNELQAARIEGKSVAELAEEKGVNLEDLEATMIEARKADLEQLVKDGIITQDQMDLMLANMESMIEAAVQRDTVGPMNGQGRSMGRGQGGRWNSNVDNQQQLRQPGNCIFGGGMRSVN